MKVVWLALSSLLLAGTYVVWKEAPGEAAQEVDLVRVERAGAELEERELPISELASREGAVVLPPAVRVELAARREGSK